MPAEARLTRRFQSRRAAGKRLGEALATRRGEDLVVLGLGQAGMPVAAEVAKRLAAPLDVLVVRGVRQPANAASALAMVDEAGCKAMRRGRPRLDLEGRCAVVVDDGSSSRSTARLACDVVRWLGAREVVFASPFIDARVRAGLPPLEEVVSLVAPGQRGRIGTHYGDRTPVGEQEVAELLEAADRRMQAQRFAQADPEASSELAIPTDGVELAVELKVPSQPLGLVVLVNASGSRSQNPRHRFVATALAEAGLATALLTLLTEEEGLDWRSTFAIPRLAHRLAEATAYLQAQPGTAGLPTGYFGESTGAAAAICAASAMPASVGAVVSRGGRLDLSGPAVEAVRAPTLLIESSIDGEVLSNNSSAVHRLNRSSKLVRISCPAHLFEEPGSLIEVANLARAWFLRYLVTGPDPLEVWQGPDLPLIA